MPSTTIKTFEYNLDGVRFTADLFQDGNGLVTAKVTMLEGSADFNSVLWADAEGGPDNFAFQGANADLNVDVRCADINWDGGFKMGSPVTADVAPSKDTFLSAGETGFVSLPGVTSLDQVDALGFKGSNASTPDGEINAVAGEGIPATCEPQEPGEDDASDDDDGKSCDRDDRGHGGGKDRDDDRHGHGRHGRGKDRDDDRDDDDDDDRGGRHGKYGHKDRDDDRAGHGRHGRDRDDDRDDDCDDRSGGTGKTLFGKLGFGKSGWGKTPVKHHVWNDHQDRDDDDCDDDRDGDRGGRGGDRFGAGHKAAFDPAAFFRSLCRDDARGDDRDDDRDDDDDDDDHHAGGGKHAWAFFC